MSVAPAGPGLSRDASANRRTRIWLVAAAVVLPLVFFRDAAVAPLSRIPCEVATPNCLNGDPLIVMSVMARAWHRFDRGDFGSHDDRIFAPYPDAWAMGEPIVLPALVAYPWARLTGAPAAGYNVALWFACAAALLSAGALFVRLGGPGAPAVFGAILYAWGPARLNNLGVLMILWAGLVPLVLAFGLDVLERRRFAVPLFAAAWIALGFGSLYGILMGALVVAIVLTLAAIPLRERRLRLAVAAGAALVAALPLLFVHRPLFHLERDFDATVPRELMEGQAADVLSLARAGAYGGPAAAALTRLGPWIPSAGSALFPLFSALFALALYVAVRQRGQSPAGLPERRFGLWFLLAGATLLFALGPTIRFAGIALAPGPWALFARLPVFQSMRGLFRWDQWWDLAVCALFVLSLSRAVQVLRPPMRRMALAVAAALVAFDVWPARLPAARLPSPSPFTDEIRALPEDAIVAVHPYVREVAARGTFEQTLHGRRLLDSFQTFAPPVHRWLFARTARVPFAESFELYRELGASAVDVDVSRLEARDRADLDALRREPSGRDIERAVERGDRVLFLLLPREPVLIDAASANGLVFQGGVATAPGRAGRLAFRLRRSVWPATTADGAASARASLTWDLVGAGGLRVRLDPVPPPGRAVFSGGRLVGRTE